MADPPGIDRLAAFTNREELRELRALLPPDERVVYAVDGEAQGRRGLLAATDRRILFLAPGMFRQRAWSFGYRELSRIEVQLERDQAIVHLAGPRGPLEVRGVDRRLAQEFAAAADRAAKEGPSRFRSVDAVQAGSELDPPAAGTPERELEDRIVRIERMRLRGSMTEPESRVAIRRIVESAGLPADAVARALRRAKSEEAPRPVGYEWSTGRGMTTKDPVTTEEDPARTALDAAPRKEKQAAHGRVEAAARPLSGGVASASRPRSEVDAERPRMDPLRSASRPPVSPEAERASVPPLRSAAPAARTAQPEPTDVAPLRSASRGPTDLEDERAVVAPPKSAARKSVEVEGPLVDMGGRRPAEAAKDEAKALEPADKGKKDKDKPSIWPPLPEE